MYASLDLCELFHWARVIHICFSKLCHHWFTSWFGAWPAPNHYLNQCCNIVNGAIGNKIQWNLNENLYIFVQENAFENVVWKMASILSRPQCVKSASRLMSGIPWHGHVNYDCTVFAHGNSRGTPRLHFRSTATIKGIISWCMFYWQRLMKSPLSLGHG